MSDSPDPIEPLVAQMLKELGEDAVGRIAALPPAQRETWVALVSFLDRRGG